jgi:hypothetical protein
VAGLSQSVLNNRVSIMFIDELAAGWLPGDAAQQCRPA